MNRHEALVALAREQNPSLIEKIEEYNHLYDTFKDLTGQEHPNESFLLDILLIADHEQQKKAARVAKRLRYLGRIVCSQLHY
jgi:hypothetical protein